MPEPPTITVAQISELASRLVTASGSVKLPRPLRSDLAVAALLISTLLRAGVIAGPITLGERDG